MLTKRKNVAAPAPSPQRVVSFDTIAEMRASLTLAEQMARRSEDYAKRDPAQLEGAIRARARADATKALLQDAIAHSTPGTSTLEQMMQMTGLASEIVQAILPLREGTANSVVQQEIYKRMCVIVFAVAKKQRSAGAMGVNVDQDGFGAEQNGTTS